MNKRQYLELMGIDVWQRRPARPVIPQDEAAVPVEAESGIAQIKRLTAVEPGSESANDSQTSSIKSTSNKTTSNKEASKPDQPSQAKPVGPSFLLVFADFPGVSIVSMYSNDLASMPANHQRFVSTLFYGLTGEKTSAQLQDFRWPMLKSSHVSQTADEAKQILKQHVKSRAPLILAFGEAAHYMGLANAADYARVLHEDKDIFALPDLQHFFKTPLARRELWQKLDSVRAELRQGRE